MGTLIGRCLLYVLKPVGEGNASAMQAAWAIANTFLMHFSKGRYFCVDLMQQSCQIAILEARKQQGKSQNAAIFDKMETIFTDGEERKPFSLPASLCV